MLAAASSLKLLVFGSVDLTDRELYSTKSQTDLDFGFHRAHHVGGAKHSLVIRVARAVNLRRTGSAIAGRRVV